MILAYQQAVIKHYFTKKDLGMLSTNLLHPTAARLREECLIQFLSADKGSDILLLRSFFRIPLHKKLQEITIKRFDIDKFKPLINLLREKTKSTEIKNIELLAFLTDFPRRPYFKSHHEKEGHLSQGDKNIDCKFDLSNQLFDTKKSEIVIEYPSGIRLFINPDGDFDMIKKLLNI